MHLKPQLSLSFPPTPHCPPHAHCPCSWHGSQSYEAASWWTMDIHSVPSRFFLKRTKQNKTYLGHVVWAQLVVIVFYHVDIDEPIVDKYMSVKRNRIVNKTYYLVIAVERVAEKKWSCSKFISNSESDDHMTFKLILSWISETSNLNNATSLLILMHQWLCRFFM